MSTSPFTYLYTEEVYTIPPSVVVITARPWESLSDDHKVLLSKILSSVKVGLASVRLLTRSAVTLDDLASLGSTKFLIFGVDTPFAPYQPVQAHGFSVIKADDFGELDDAKKKSLWLGLKSVFGL